MNTQTHSAAALPLPVRLSDEEDRLRELLAFDAPYVAEKLLSNKSASSLDEGRLLFEEAKKYLWLIATDRERSYPVPSLRVDEAWHQFLLFTVECREFCQRIFGCYMHHAPPTADAPPEGTTPKVTVTPEMFAARYKDVFGADLPEVWRDDLSIEPSRRLVKNELIGDFAVRVHDGRTELVDRASGRVHVRVDAWAEPALRFMVDKGVFYVRELPTLDTDEKVELCRTLVQTSVLLVMP